MRCCASGDRSARGTPLCPAGHLPLKGGDWTAAGRSAPPPPLAGRCPRSGRRGVAPLHRRAEASPTGPSDHPPHKGEGAANDDLLLVTSRGGLRWGSFSTPTKAATFWPAPSGRPTSWLPRRKKGHGDRRRRRPGPVQGRCRDEAVRGGQRGRDKGCSGDRGAGFFPPRWSRSRRCGSRSIASSRMCSSMTKTRRCAPTAWHCSPASARRPGRWRISRGSRGVGRPCGQGPRIRNGVRPLHHLRWSPADARDGAPSTTLRVVPLPRERGRIYRRGRPLPIRLLRRGGYDVAAACAFNPPLRSGGGGPPKAVEGALRGRGPSPHPGPPVRPSPLRGG